MSLAKSGGQYQVVVGSDVPNIYRALEGLLDLDEVSKESSEKQDRTPLQSFLALISGIFTPILPVITAAGMIKADRKSTRLNSSHEIPSRMPSSA